MYIYEYKLNLHTFVLTVSENLAQLDHWNKPIRIITQHLKNIDYKYAIIIAVGTY